jgi:hypothetical protein
MDVELGFCQAGRSGQGYLVEALTGQAIHSGSRHCFEEFEVSSYLNPAESSCAT